MTDVAPTVIGLPAALGRRMRLGPFPSARHAMRFLAYAALGVAVAAWVSPLAWVPFVGVGFVLSAVSTDGRTLDEHAGAFVRYYLRGGPGLAPRPLPRIPRRGGVRARAGGRWLAALRVDGLLLRVGTEPLSGAAFRPPSDPDRTEPEQAALRGYDEMVRLLCRHRHRRRVELVLWTRAAPAADRTSLEDRVEALSLRLAALGLHPERATGLGLVAALRRAGLTVTEVE